MRVNYWCDNEAELRVTNQSEYCMTVMSKSGGSPSESSWLIPGTYDEDGKNTWQEEN